MKPRGLRAGLRTLAVVATVGLAIGLPVRAEWTRYRQEVPVASVTRAEVGQAVTYGHIRWRLLDYDQSSELNLPVGVGYTDFVLDVSKPSGPDEVWVYAELIARSLSKAGDRAELDVRLRDSSGRTWVAGLYPGSIAPSTKPDAHGRVGVAGVVPARLADEVTVQVEAMVFRMGEFSSVPKGPKLVFGR